MKINHFLLISLLFILVNCSTPKLGFINLAPRTTSLPAKINRTLYIKLDNVKDSLIMRGDIVTEMKITSFRQSVNEAVKKAFKNSFSSVILTNELHENELTLNIFRIEPYWKVVRSQVVSNGKSSQKVYFASAVFQVQATLYDRGVEISRFDDKIIGSQEMPAGSRKPQKFFIGGFQLAMEAIHEALVITNDTYKKIN